VDAFAAAADSLPGRIEAAQRAIAIRLTDFKAPDRSEQNALNEALRALRQLISETKPSEAEDVADKEKVPRPPLNPQEQP
jgi:hypothetical protein